MNDQFRTRPTGSFAGFLRANPELPILAAAGFAALIGRRASLRRGAARITDGLTDSAHGLGEGAGSAKMHFLQGAQVLTQLSVRETVGRLSGDPLALAAAGLAVGAVVGALAPGTRLEDSLFGELGQKARTAALRALDEQAERVKTAGAAARDKLREEMALHELNVEGIETMAKHVADAAKTGAAKTGAARSSDVASSKASDDREEKDNV